MSMTFNGTSGTKQHIDMFPYGILISKDQYGNSYFISYNKFIICAHRFTLWAASVAFASFSYWSQFSMFL